MRTKMERTAAGGRRVVFVGAVHEAEPALRALLDADAQTVAVVTAPTDRGAVRSGFVDLEPLAASRGVPVARVTDLNAADSVDRIRGLAPDLIVVVGWSQLVGDTLLRLPRRGCVGFHASLLPHGRGRAPVNWAIIRGERQTGNTMMFLAPGADTGDVVARRQIPIGPDDTCADVYRAVGEAGAAMLAEQLPLLLTGTAPRWPQDDRAASYLPKRVPSMGITDWDRPARAVHDWIRAQTRPYPGAFSQVGERTVMLWRSALTPEDRTLEDRTPGAGRTWVAGTMLGLEAGGMRVATRDASLLLTQVGDPDGHPEPAHAWFSRNGFHSGDRFDPVAPDQASWALGLGPRPRTALVGAR